MVPQKKRLNYYRVLLMIQTVTYNMPKENLLFRGVLVPYPELVTEVFNLVTSGYSFTT